MNTEITLRDFFAAHAPEQIPPWFCHGDDLPPLPLILSNEGALGMQAGYAELHEHDKDAVRQWMADGSWDLDDPKQTAIARAAIAAVIQSSEARREAEEQRTAEKYFAWRWHYANAMLAARKL